jgi:ABC-type Fe3+/spermidine/putrescine transport system ATPase subunit
MPAEQSIDNAMTNDEPQPRPAGLELRRVSKQLGEVLAVDDVSLRIREGEFFTLLGPSGSGKTTSLNMVGGFIAPDRGDIFIRNRSMGGVAPEHRDIGIVFQNYALFPHMSVLENVAFPLRRRGISRPEAARRARAALEMVSLEGREKARPLDLSGGQQQRAALARALVFEPQVVLLDEPLGALDRRLRQRLQEQLRQLHRRLSFTALYITHDQEEALALSDRIGIMNDGRLEQIGSGEECYQHPATLFVAGFLGDANLVHADVVDQLAKDRCVVRVPTPDMNGVGALEAWHPPTCAPRTGDRIHLLARPEALEITAGDDDRRPSYARGRLVERVFLGQDVLGTVAREGAEPVIVRERVADHDLDGQVGDDVTVVWRNAGGAVALPQEAVH